VLTEDLQGQALPYPEIAHAEMTKRALERRPPFNEDGGGYRDSPATARPRRILPA
jgi:hypothetical protein